MIIFGGLKEQSDNQDIGHNQKIKVGQITQNLFDRLIDDDKIKEVVDDSTVSDDSYEFIIKELYLKIANGKH